MSVLIALLVRHIHWLLGAAVLAVVAGAGAFLAHTLDAPALRRAEAEAAAARTAAAVQTAQTGVEQAAAAAVQTAQTREASLARTTETVAHALVADPLADQAVPPAVLRDWGAGVDRLRDEAARARAAPAGAAGGGDLAGAVPPP